MVNNVTRAGDQFTLSDSANNSNISGEQLVYNMETRQGEAQRSRFETSQEDRRIQGVSEKMAMLGDNRYQLLHSARF